MILMVKHGKVIVASNRAAQHLLRCAAGIAVCAGLAGCPQGSGPAPTAAISTAVQSAAAVAVQTPSSPPESTDSGSATGASPAPEAPQQSDVGPATVSPPVSAGPQAEVSAVNLSQQSLQQVPMTFGEPFRDGDIPDGHTIVAYMGGRKLPTQADIKARNPDGSVRHAILTVQLPSLDGGASMPLNLRATPGPSTPAGK